jgi:hypothetical protein
LMWDSIMDSIVSASSNNPPKKWVSLIHLC